MTAPVCDIDFYGPDVLADPIAAYHKMLKCGPVVWLEAQSIHAVCGYNAVTEVLRAADVFRSGEGVSIDETMNQFLKGSTLNSDRPEHDRRRAITFAPLTPKALAEVKARVEAEARAIAETVTQAGDFDAARDLAPYLPLSVVRDLVGLGDHGKAHMLDWGAATFELMGDPK